MIIFENLVYFRKKNAKQARKKTLKEIQRCVSLSQSFVLSIQIACSPYFISQILFKELVMEWQNDARLSVTTFIEWSMTHARNQGPLLDPERGSSTTPVQCWAAVAQH